MSVPDTIQDVLDARASTGWPTTRAAPSRSRSVIGREFALRLLARITEAGDAHPHARSTSCARSS